MDAVSGRSEGFRLEARAWLEANCPAEMRTPQHGEQDVCWGGRNYVFQSPAQKLWLERMVGKGWTVPRWPVECGGAGLSAEEENILVDEMKRIGARPPLEGFGISMIGPALLKFGNEQQKSTHLPRIARGEIRWCQGYSEPNAGSDLAALATRAEDRGDHFLVNGEKIWTSHADKSDWIFCLVRTDAEAPKHKGISFVLLDMANGGVTTKPIVLISGRSSFCQTFFNNVRVPRENLLGELNTGWTVAKYLLDHEREMIGAGGSSLFDTDTVNLAAAEVAARNGGVLPEGNARSAVARLAVDTLAFEATRLRYLDMRAQGIELGAKASVVKFYGTELNKKRQEAIMSLAGFDALYCTEDNAEAGALPLFNQTATTWLRSKANSIEGGTSEIMLEIIAKRILNLPG
jgi:acyl-CoA dehydrogenase